VQKQSVCVNPGPNPGKRYSRCVRAERSKGAAEGTSPFPGRNPSEGQKAAAPIADGRMTARGKDEHDILSSSVSVRACAKAAAPPSFQNLMHSSACSICIGLDGGDHLCRQMCSGCQGSNSVVFKSRSPTEDVDEVWT
jgi:hypothetical protein